MAGTLTAVVGALRSGGRVDRLDRLAALRLAGVRIGAVRTNVGAVIAVRASRASSRVVVAVVSGWDVHTDLVERVVSHGLHRGREHVGSRESNSTRCEADNRGRGQQLESCPAHLRAAC
jgi:hypothetical protein